jgi:hypothetical protein
MQAVLLQTHLTTRPILRCYLLSFCCVDVLTPPEPKIAEFVPGSVVLSTDGRLLAVAAALTGLPPNIAESSQLIAGYVYKVVADSHAQKVFRYQLAGRLMLPVDPYTTSSSSSWSNDSHATTHVDMSADGQVVMACWAYSDNQATATGQSVAPSGGAAVFSWKGFGLQALQLPVPQGMCPAHPQAMHACMFMCLLSLFSGDSTSCVKPNGARKGVTALSCSSRLTATAACTEAACGPQPHRRAPMLTMTHSNLHGRWQVLLLCQK